MERSDAERVFVLLSEINGDLEGKIVSERWWLVWIAVGIEIMITSATTHLIFNAGEDRLGIYLLVWGLHVALIPPIIWFIHRASGGQRTSTERYIWWIWTTFIAASTLVAVFNHVAELSTAAGAPVVALLGAFAFSMMAMITHRLFLICAAIFLGVMIAMTLLPEVQFLIFGIAWMSVLIGLGVYFRLTITTHETQRL